ncbi:hypothetical protein HDU98_005841 [Podochytrium sp. JEL0797]|nr:hypothetical protein HDU98_005841 [Podochytrium sp. JEL0797]
MASNKDYILSDRSGTATSEADKTQTSIDVINGTNVDHPSMKMAEEGCVKDSAADELDYPDGGLAAWGVVLASFLAQFIVWGCIYSFGVYNNYYISSGVGTSTQVSFISGVGFVFIPALGIPAGQLAQRYGYRKVVFAGSILCSLGVFLASFTSDLGVLIATQGALFGIGGSLVYFPAVALPSQWFSKRRGLAQGIGASGSGLGGLFFSSVLQQLLNNIGLAWTLRCSAIFFLVILVAINPLFKVRLHPSKSDSKVEFSILKNPRFVFLLLSAFFANFAMFCVVNFLPVYSTERGGLSDVDAATILSIYNGFGAVGKVAMGLGADTLLGNSNALIISMWVTVASVFSWLATSGFGSITAFAIINGTVGGGFWALLPVVIASMFGVEGLMSRVTLLYTALAAGNFAGPILAAVIQEQCGFDWMIIYCGILALAAAICGTVSRFLFEPVLFKKV